MVSLTVLISVLTMVILTVSGIFLYLMQRDFKRECRVAVKELRLCRSEIQASTATVERVILKLTEIKE